MNNRANKCFIRLAVVLVTALLLCFQPAVPAHAVIHQSQSEVKQFESGHPVEREIAGGESHLYPIKLSAGQFVRVVAVQRGINIVIVLADSDGKEIWEANFSGNFGGHESLSFEAAAGGEYRILVRPFSSTAQKGIYELTLAVNGAATADDKKRIHAERLLMEGLKSLRQSNFQPAIDRALQVLPLWRELGDAYWESDTMSLLGSGHNSIRKFDQAADYYNQALLLRRQVKDRAGESNALSDLSVVAAGQNKYEPSLAYAAQALEIKRELKDRAGEGNALSLMATAALRLGRYAAVIEYSDKMFEIFSELGDKAGIGNSYNAKGSCYFNQRRYDDATRNYEKALENFREAKNQDLEGRVLHNLGLVKRMLGQYDESLEFYQKALTIRQAINDRLAKAFTLSAIGGVLTLTGEYEKAIKHLDEALSISRELKDATSEASALMNIGSLYQRLGQNEKALESSEATVSIVEPLKNPFLTAQAYRILADIAYQQGLSEKDVEYREKLLVLEREAKNREGETNRLIDAASSYRRLGRDDRALEYLQQGLVNSREMKSKTLEAYVLANIGLLYTTQKNYREAIGYHQQALAFFREAKMQGGEGRTLINLSECLQKLGRPEESIGLLTQALSLLREIKDRDGESISLGNLGTAYYTSGQYAKAAESLAQALEIARELKSPDRLREALNELARLERNRGDLASATAYLEQSLKSLESSRSEIYNPQSRATFLAAEQENLHLHIDVLMRRHFAEPSKGFDVLAVEANERSRARVLLELLSEARINIRQDVDVALLAQEQALGQKINIWAQRLEQATKPELKARLKLELSQLEGEFERTQAAIRKASPQYASLTQPQPLNFKEIQAQLDVDTLLLAYSLGEERSYLWAITKDSLTSYELPKAELVKQGAMKVYELLTARSTGKRGESISQRRDRLAKAEANLPGAAQSLSKTLLAPVAAELGKKRLVIVADGALQYIPFAMLPEPGRGVGEKGSSGEGEIGSRAVGLTPLIVNHEIVSLPSASALAIQRAELAGRQPAPKMLAVIADPVFDRTDVRFTTPATAVDEKQQTQTRTLGANSERTLEHLAEKQDEKAVVTTRTLVIPRLPFTRQEGNQLLALTRKASSFRAMDFEASRATVLSGDLSQYRYVHFATHGVLDTERPGLSALVLSMVDAQGKPQDGFLRANDIYNLKLPAELVVLSACQTGLGKDIKGEGLVGLTRGFMYAGAARVVVSLWNVNDKATAELMTKFYEKMLKLGERPAAALRAAQVEMWKQKQWQSPYYWAAFTMQGEWR